METLKRDWDTKLTLRDVLVTICCLLIQPNPDSALNAEAGALIRDDYEAFSRRAKLMTSIHAVVPRALRDAVHEAQERGQEISEEPEGKKMQGDALEGPVAQPDGGEPVRRRRTVARVRSTAAARRADTSPSGAAARRRPQPGPSRPFAIPAAGDDIFGLSRRDHEQIRAPSDTEEESTIEPNQENDATRSPAKTKTPAKLTTPRRPPGTPIPLGELTMEDAPSPPETSNNHTPEQQNGWDTSEDMSPEYPPSPRKSPSKSPKKRKDQQPAPVESNHNPFAPAGAANTNPLSRGLNITPPNLHTQTLAASSPFAPTAADTHFRNPTPSPRKLKKRVELFTPHTVAPPPRFEVSGDKRRGGGGVGVMGKGKGVLKSRCPSSSSSASETGKVGFECQARSARLWELCGGNVGRWNRGEFGKEVGWEVKASRW